MYLTIVNGANFDNYMESLDNAFGVTSIKGTTVIGDVYVKSITGVSAINLVDVETLLNVIIAIRYKYSLYLICLC